MAIKMGCQKRIQEMKKEFDDILHDMKLVNDAIAKAYKK
jgi:hypothetical protein